MTREDIESMAQELYPGRAAEAADLIETAIHHEDLGARSCAAAALAALPEAPLPELPRLPDPEAPAAVLLGTLRRAGLALVAAEGLQVLSRPLRDAGLDQLLRASHGRLLDRIIAVRKRLEALEGRRA